MNNYVSLVALAAMLTCAGNVQAETLEQMVQHVYKQHPSLAAAKAKLDQLDFQVKSNVSGYFPTISASAQAGRLYGDNSTSRGLSVTRGSGYSGFGEGSVSARQVLFDGLETSKKIKATTYREQAQRYETMDQRDKLAMQAVEIYLSILKYQDILSLLRHGQDSLQAQMDVIQEAVSSGAVSEIDHHLANESYYLLESTIVDFQGQLESTIAEYEEIRGGLPETALIVPAFNTSLLPETIDGILAMSFGEHPQISAMRARVRSADEQIGVQKADLFPDVTGELSYLKNDKRDVIGGEAVDSRAIVRVSWDLETGGGQLHRIKEAKAAKAEMEAELEKTEREVERSLRQAISERKAAEASMKTSQKRVEIADEIYQALKTQFEGGDASPLQVMQAEQQKILSKYEYTEAQYRYLLSQYALLAATGTLQQSLLSEKIALADD